MEREMALLLPGEERIKVCERTVGSIREDEDGVWWAIGPDDDDWVGPLESKGDALDHVIRPYEE